MHSHCRPLDTEWLQLRINDRVIRIKQWTAADRLALSPGKTELLWITTPRTAHLISHALLLIDKGRIAPSTQVRLLRVLWDETLAFNDHVSNVSRSCYHQLRRIREIVIPLVRAFILTRIDYCNFTLLGLPPVSWVTCRWCLMLLLVWFFELDGVDTLRNYWKMSCIGYVSQSELPIRDVGICSKHNMIQTSQNA